nr:Cdc25 protein [Sipunculus nudus]
MNKSAKSRGLRLPLSLRSSNVKSSPSMTSSTTIYSPMTDLAHNLLELSTGYDGETPKRRLDLSSIANTPTPTHNLKPLSLEKHLSDDAGCCLDSPNPMVDSPLPQSSKFSNFFKRKSSTVEHKGQFQSAALARFQRLPVPFCNFDTDHEDEPENPVSPDEYDREGSTSLQEKAKFFISDDENSWDSGVCVETSGQVSDDFQFAEPSGPAPRRVRNLNEDACSPFKYSPAKDSLFHRSFSTGALNFDSPSLDSDSPIILRKSSLTYSPEQDEGDDGFLELTELDDKDHEKADDVPSSMNSLFNAPMVLNEKNNDRLPLKSRRLSFLTSEDAENQPPKTGSRRGLFKSPSVPRLYKSSTCESRPSGKRSEPEGRDTPYTRIKRRKSVVDLESQDKEEVKSRSLPRCHSEAMIKAALNRLDQPGDLIGDCSRKHQLPIIQGKHSDLQAIAPKTVEELVEGQLSHLIEKFIIIDCRYPYEYEGGQIKGAINLYTKDQILEEFIKSTKHHPTDSSNSNTVLIFHCEFSSERGPKMYRFLREQDRAVHKDCYPSLHYPEMYVLEGGYKAFFENHKPQCVPQTYKPMLHKDHANDMKHFRAKSKSWAGERGRGARGPIRPGLKF